MSLFKQKNKSSNAKKSAQNIGKQADEKALSSRLAAENAALKSRLEKLAEINDQLNARIAKLQSEAEAAKERKSGGDFFDRAASPEEKKTAEEIAEAESVIVRAKDIISKAERESEEIKNAALARYKAEIKRIKALVCFADAELAANGAETAKDKRKLALVAALKEMLDFDETALTAEQASEKADDLTGFLQGGRRPEDDSFFDLDAVLNTKEDLDLEELCRELGVME